MFALSLRIRFLVSFLLLPCQYFLIILPAGLFKNEADWDICVNCGFPCTKASSSLIQRLKMSVHAGNSVTSKKDSLIPC